MAPTSRSRPGNTSVVWRGDSVDVEQCAIQVESNCFDVIHLGFSESLGRFAVTHSSVRELFHSRAMRCHPRAIAASYMLHYRHSRPRVRPTNISSVPNAFTRLYLCEIFIADESGKCLGNGN